MHRLFAGILGTAAFATTIVRGWFLGDDAAAIMPRSIASLVLFALLGAVFGRLALWMVEEGVTAQLRDSLAVRDKK